MLASIVFDDFFEVGETLLKANPEVQKLCKSFGINSMDEVAIDPWPSETSNLLNDRATRALCLGWRYQLITQARLALHKSMQHNVQFWASSFIVGECSHQFVPFYCSTDTSVCNSAVLLQFIPWDGSMGSTHKQIMGLMYWRSSPDDNIYAHPLPWVPILDVATKEVFTPWLAPPATVFVQARCCMC